MWPQLENPLVNGLAPKVDKWGVTTLMQVLNYLLDAYDVVNVVTEVCRSGGSSLCGKVLKIDFVHFVSMVLFCYIFFRFENRCCDICEGNFAAAITKLTDR